MRICRYTLIALSGAFSGFSQAQAGETINIFFGLGDEFAQTEGDIEQLSWFTDRGYNVDLWDNAEMGADGTAAVAAANAADLVYTSESISSGRVRQLEGTTTPMIISEQFGADVLGFFREGDSTYFDDDHGSPTAQNASFVEIKAGSSFGTSVEIVNEDHPIARRAGLANGPHVVYDDQGLGVNGGGRLSWVDVGADLPAGSADVIALLPPYKDTFPNASALFVVEAGQPLEPNNIARDYVEGNTYNDVATPNAPGMRIFTFLSDTNRGPEEDPLVAGSLSFGEADGTGPGWESTLLTDEGKALIFAAIDYALGLIPDFEPGDFNKDGAVDGNDFLLWQANFPTAEGATQIQGDANGDGAVDGNDFLIWQAAFGVDAGGGSTAVPEPGTAVLLTLLLINAPARRRR